jgi:hypothetical protein
VGIDRGYARIPACARVASTVVPQVADAFLDSTRSRRRFAWLALARPRAAIGAE